MTYTVPPVDINADNWGDAINKLNLLIDGAANNFVTIGADPNNGNLDINGGLNADWQERGADMKIFKDGVERDATPEEEVEILAAQKAESAPVIPTSYILPKAAAFGSIYIEGIEG